MTSPYEKKVEYYRSQNPRHPADLDLDLGRGETKILRVVPSKEAARAKKRSRWAVGGEDEEKKSSQEEEAFHFISLGER